MIRVVCSHLLFGRMMNNGLFSIEVENNMCVVYDALNMPGDLRQI